MSSVIITSLFHNTALCAIADDNNGNRISGVGNQRKITASKCVRECYTVGNRTDMRFVNIDDDMNDDGNA